MKWFDGKQINIKEYTGEELAGKIAEDMYQMDKEQVLEYPQFIQTAYFIIDFDTELVMEGIYGVLENSIGAYLPNIIQAFQAIGDKKDADILSEIISLVSPEQLREEITKSDFMEYQITSFNECHDIDEETGEQIESLSNELYLHTDFDMWGMLFEYLTRSINKEKE